MIHFLRIPSSFEQVEYEPPLVGQFIISHKTERSPLELNSSNISEHCPWRSGQVRTGEETRQARTASLTEQLRPRMLTRSFSQSLENTAATLCPGSGAVLPSRFSCCAMGRFDQHPSRPASAARWSSVLDVEFD